MSRVHNTSDKVNTLLELNPELINSDKMLIIHYLQTYCDSFIPFSLRQAILSADTPPFESITRARRKYQETHNVEVKSRVEKQRWEQEQYHHDYFGR